jgi:hypothetical protein
MKTVKVLLLIITVAVAYGISLADKREAQFPGFGYAEEQEAWRKDFDFVCSQTQDAMLMKVEELKSLIERCDRVQAQIAKLDESQKKVYTRRLKMCKDLYVFMLDTAEKK